MCRCVPVNFNVSPMQVRGPVTRVGKEAERVLRSLPAWFGIEESLLEYASNADVLPTFVAQDSSGSIVGFLSLREHFASSWEIDAVAVQAGFRGHGIGKALLEHAESWLRSRGAAFLQVKTLAAVHPSKEYAETRRFYESVGFQPFEVMPMLWGKGLPVLIYVKNVGGQGHEG